jgi:uncharacterized protein YvpB
MKKRLTAVVLSMALIVANLVSCSDRNDSESSESKVTETTTTTATTETKEDTSSENGTTTEETTTETSKEDDSSSDESSTTTTAVTDSSTVTNSTTTTKANTTTTAKTTTTTKATTAATTQSTSGSKSSNRVILDVKNIQQKPELPTGCEITAATIALNYYGFKVNKMEMLDYLNISEAPDQNGYWKNPYSYYIGNPKLSTGYGCYSAVIKYAIEDYWEDNNINNYSINGLSRTDFINLYNEIDKKNPVIIWVGRYMKDIEIGKVKWKLIDGSIFEWTSNEHCVVLIGYDKNKDTVILSDPLDPKGTVEYPRKTVEKVYNQMDRQALVIHKK